MSNKFELPQIVSEKNTDFIYENMVAIKSHIKELEKQFATLHLLTFFERFPQVESVDIVSDEIERDWYSHNYEIVLLEEYMDDASVNLLEIEHDIKNFFDSYLDDLPSPYCSFDAKIDRDNIKKVFRQLMGEEKFDIWQISLEKEKMEDNLNNNVNKQSGKLKI